MVKFYKILFFNTLVIGTLISISSYSWFSMWMGLEINLLSIIPLMSSQKNLYPSEAALKYFITQALASSILLFSIVMNLNMSELIPQSFNYFIMTMMNSSFFTKMGAAPFHAWFPEVMDGLDWNNCLIMLTWQKIAPMVLMMYTLQTSMFIVTIIISSTIIGSILGLNQTSLRKIMAYSSINHIGWMIASMLNSQTIWMIYFVIYTIISFNIVVILDQIKSFQMKQLNSSLNANKMIKLLFMMNFLSLGGIPPFLGFLPKWLTINNLIYNNFIVLSLILIVFTLVTLFYYLRITFSTMVINSEETMILQKKKLSFMIFFINLLSLAGLAACSLIFNLY
uniref:NADH-ubiquinone oxidoreductase chain 2 n=1 Tax=Chrysomeloidea sp. 5 KM-2017 TaxID=2219299 RepID=A0A346RIR4_9CUCU|nr:NADH dehydrogenase subunit 2 [Chrysomeloidea sp. 5 KM-2017]